MVRQIRRAAAGFTLMELLIVVIIIGILVTLALPGFQRSMEAARQAEARTILGNLYQAERAYYAEKETYTTASDTANPLMAPIPPVGSPEHYFSYGVTATGATGFIATATRKTTGAPTSSRAPDYGTPYTITINQSGNYTSSNF